MDDAVSNNQAGFSHGTRVQDGMTTKDVDAGSSGRSGVRSRYRNGSTLGRRSSSQTVSRDRGPGQIGGADLLRLVLLRVRVLMTRRMNWSLAERLPIN